MYRTLLAAAMLLVLASFGASAANPELIPFQKNPDTAQLPAMATVAGFTQVVVNNDFTNTFYANKANWLDCNENGSPSPHPIWFQGYKGVETGTHMPCQYVSQATDPVTGTLALKMHWDDAFWQGAPNIQGNRIETFDLSGNPGTNGFAGTFYYAEFVARFSNPQETVDYGVWSIAQNDAFFEFDGMELSSSAADSSSNVHNHVGSANFDGGTYSGQCPPGVGCFDPTAYNKYAWRVTSDGSTGSYYCTYINDQMSGTCTQYQATPGQLAGDTTMSTGVQIQNADRTESCPGRQSSTTCGTVGDMWIQSARIITCGAWTPGNTQAQCYSSSPNP